MGKSENINIFSSRCLSKNLVDKITNAGLHFEQQDFIKVDNTFNEESFINSLQNTNTQARVFTSKNSVRSLKKLLASKTVVFEPKKTFTVGIKATEMLMELGIKSSVRANNAISLAQIIARNSDVQAVDFFCGNKSLDDLPEYLESKNINVNREIVYQTELVHEKIETEHFNGLIFLSPTAVYSFFKKNKIESNIPTFCIGATTAEAVHLRCDNPKILANQPSIESVVDKVIEYFKK